MTTATLTTTPTTAESAPIAVAPVAPPRAVQPAPNNKAKAAASIAAAAEPDLIEAMVAYVISVEPALQAKRAEITADLRAEFGGQRVYLSARPQTDREKRVRNILSLFNGRNATEVARRLGVSRATVYRTIKQPGLQAGAGK